MGIVGRLEERAARGNERAVVVEVGEKRIERMGANPSVAVVQSRKVSR